MLTKKEERLCNRHHGYAQLYTGIKKFPLWRWFPQSGGLILLKMMYNREKDADKLNFSGLHWDREVVFQHAKRYSLV